VYGWPKQDSFAITDPIGRDAGDIRRWTTGKGMRGVARDASTHIEVLKRFGNAEYEGKGNTKDGVYSFIEARPKTGRTHQIRVHLRSINHPIIADSLYAPKRDKALGFERQALHARSLTLMLETGEIKTVIAPYPEDFERALQACR
jgi:23S rRNA pseudouridine1911/1915/1917 synthase